MDDLGNIRPDVVTRATQYIDKIVAFIQDLLKKGYAYKAKDGSIYFSISKFKDYGRLSRLDKEGIKAGARVDQDQYDKENPSDFALWKAWDEGDGEIYWETGLGKGRPGWSIECSAMSQDVLGDTIDIHTGGVDLIFPHHENEIAQSEARTGKKFVNYWLHNEHLLVDGRKMSKSLSNFYVLEDIKSKGFSPLDLRYFYIGAHYRSKINFTWEAIEASRNARQRLNSIIGGLRTEQEGEVNQEYISRFEEALSSDLNSPEAFAVLWALIRDEKIKPNDRFATVIAMDKYLGLSLGEVYEEKIPENVKDLAEKRKQARIERDFEGSDKLREEILSKGWVIEDKPNNDYELKKK
jgi:cysteinyl-tRNA synthetase